MTRALICLLMFSACAPAKKEVKEYADVVVQCAKADAPEVLELALPMLTTALVALLNGQDPGTVFRAMADAAEAGVKSNGLAVAACAFDRVIADITHLLHPDKPGVSTRAMTAGTVSDPAETGRRALASFEAAHHIIAVQSVP